MRRVLAPTALAFLASACCVGEGPALIGVVNDNPVTVHVWRHYETGKGDKNAVRIRPGEIVWLPASPSCAPDTYYAQSRDGRTADHSPVCPDETWRIRLPDATTPSEEQTPTSPPGVSPTPG